MTETAVPDPFEDFTPMDPEGATMFNTVLDEEGHSIHHVGNVHAFCCDCGCCHSTACMNESARRPMPCFVKYGEGECLDGSTNESIERPQIEATAKRLLGVVDKEENDSTAERLLNF